MSKQRPSATAAGNARTGLLRRADYPLSYWQRRVYRNTFTRAGRQRSVRVWSVKIQIRGVRRSFSLLAAHQTGAAREARQLYRRLLAGGAPPDRYQRPVSDNRTGVSARPWPATRRGAGAGRLVLRKYCCGNAEGKFSQYSARIEHQDQRYYFPLGSLEPGAATARARTIQQTAIRHGWPVVVRKFSREVTLAVHWTEQPLAWTYTSFHTLIRPANAGARRMPGPAQVPARLILVEEDPSIRTALLAGWNRSLAGEQSWHGYPTLNGLPPDRLAAETSLMLINQNLAEGPRWNQLQTWLTERPKLIVLLFSIYDDSDELFRAAPGGAGFYLLKRLAPDRILEPMANLLASPGWTRENLALQINRYFRNLMTSAQPDSLSRARLTQREQEILALLAKGYLDKEIAYSLGISSWTVHGHLKKIFEKLQVHTRTEAVVKYLQK